MISCFKYLGSLLPILGTKDTKWSVPFTGIYDDCCEKMHEFMREGQRMLELNHDIYRKRANTHR